MLRLRAQTHPASTALCHYRNKAAVDENIFLKGQHEQ